MKKMGRRFNACALSADKRNLSPLKCAHGCLLGTVAVQPSKDDVKSTALVTGPYWVVRDECRLLRHCHLEVERSGTGRRQWGRRCFRDRRSAVAHENSGKLDFSRPGKPTHNAFIASFNGRFGDECLSTHGSGHWTMPGAKSRRGHGTIISTVLTPRSAG